MLFLQKIVYCFRTRVICNFFQLKQFLKKKSFRFFLLLRFENRYLLGRNLQIKLAQVSSHNNFNKRKRSTLFKVLVAFLGNQSHSISNIDYGERRNIQKCKYSNSEYDERQSPPKLNQLLGEKIASHSLFNEAWKDTKNKNRMFLFENIFSQAQVFISNKKSIHKSRYLKRKTGSCVYIIFFIKSVIPCIGRCVELKGCVLIHYVFTRGRGPVSRRDRMHSQKQNGRSETPILVHLRFTECDKKCKRPITGKNR